MSDDAKADALRQIHADGVPVAHIVVTESLRAGHWLYTKCGSLCVSYEHQDLALELWPDVEASVPTGAYSQTPGKRLR